MNNKKGKTVENNYRDVEHIPKLLLVVIYILTNNVNMKITVQLPNLLIQLLFFKFKPLQLEDVKHS